MKKVTMLVFLTVAALMLVLPGVKTQRQENYISPMDNKSMTNFPEKWWSDLSQVEQYVNDRVGFRDQMITAYQYTDLLLFRELNHPLYQSGKGGHVYSREWDPITYQHLDGDEDFPGQMADFLLYIQNYCKENDMGFCFLLAPNKESIYPEYYPDGYGIKDQPNRSDRIMEELDKRGVNHVDPRAMLIEEKVKQPVYNQTYDVGHWNPYGMYLSVNKLYEDYLLPTYPQIQAPLLSEYKVTKEDRDYLPNSYIRMEDTESVFSLKEDTTELQWDNSVNDVYLRGWKNPSRPDAPKVLVFGDSYFGHGDLFFKEQFSETYFLHISNMWDFYGCVDLLQPDIILIEAGERVLDTDIYNLFNWQQEHFQTIMK
ncbi:MAG: hypothetical protein K5853_02925 [Lachnospiraceae bacterium]|nr:hypothetical protein [Lachnospiraceae bacterium]